jgi:hypothetical protein
VLPCVGALGLTSLSLFFVCSRFSKSQKRASGLLSDVSQSIFSALAPPVSSANVAPAHMPAAQSLLDEEDDAGSTALGRALLPDVVAASGRPACAETERHPPSMADENEEDEEGWNW